MDLTPPYHYQILDRTPGVWIQLWRPEWDGVGLFAPRSSLTEPELDAIMLWSMEHKCGIRMSWDMWKFRSEKELTLFVLKWC